MIDPAPVPQQKPSAMPIVALVLGVLGLCFPPLYLVAIVLAIISLTRSSDPRYSERRMLAFITLGLALVYIPVMGILAAIAIPNFIRFEARSKQTECKSNLRGAYTAELAYFGEHDAYSTSPTELGLSFEQTRYLYRLDRLGALGEVGVRPTHPQSAPVAQLEAGIPPAVLAQVGISGSCPTCEVTLVCAGNLDRDPVIDVWTVSTATRTGPHGEEIRPGQPFHDVDDLGD